jgi:hypothetical protein
VTTICLRLPDSDTVEEAIDKAGGASPVLERGPDGRIRGAAFTEHDEEVTSLDPCPTPEEVESAWEDGGYTPVPSVIHDEDPTLEIRLPEVK